MANNESLKRAKKEKDDEFYTTYADIEKEMNAYLEYNPNVFFNAIKGKETLGEGSIRCFSCIELRLQQTAKYAKENGYELFATTLSVSPHKNAELINNIGKTLEKKFNINYLVSDFKKKDGFKRSIELCKKYNIYRQNYCGCNL